MATCIVSTSISIHGSLRLICSTRRIWMNKASRGTCRENIRDRSSVRRLCSPGKGRPADFTSLIFSRLASTNSRPSDRWRDAGCRESRQAKDALVDILERVDQEIERIRTIGEEWFGFDADTSDTRGSFKGMTTRDTYTKAAHFALLREMLPPGPIVLTTEQEATLPAILPHVFEDEIKRNRFTWLAMTFNKRATKPEILGKVKSYRKDWKQFYNDGMYEGRFDPDTDAGTITRAFIADGMTTATKAGARKRPFPISNYQIPAFPLLWLRSPTQASGELDKVVGFPIVPRGLRDQIKAVAFDTDASQIDPEVRQELSDLIWKATMQPVSTFMNSVRERLSAAARAGSGGARVGGSYIQGAVFNPRTLIALLNIFRVHYNFFEARSYASPFADGGMDTRASKLMPRALRIPGTDEMVQFTPRARRNPERKTPAMRHGMDGLVRRKSGGVDVPDLHRLIYRPWLYAGTKVGVALDRSWSPPERGANNHNTNSSTLAAE